MGDTFNGTILLQHYREDTPEMREAYSFLNSDVPFDSILISNEELMICGDTLISIHSDVNRRPYSTYIQLRDSLYMKLKDGTFKLIRIPTGLSLLKDFFDHEIKDTILGNTTNEFSSINRIGDTEYKFKIAEELMFHRQAENKFLFSKVFSKKGFILYTAEKYVIYNLTKTTKVISFSRENQNCKEKIEELNFIEPD